VRTNDPFARLPEVPRFTITGTTVSDGDAWPAEQMSGLFGVPGRQGISPQLENERSRLEEAALPEDSPPFTGQTACRRSRRRKTRGVRAIPTAWHWPTGRT
jgi:hypothetical protein